MGLIEIGRVVLEVQVRHGRIELIESGIHFGTTMGPHRVSGRHMDPLTLLSLPHLSLGLEQRFQTQLAVPPPPWPQSLSLLAAGLEVE